MANVVSIVIRALDQTKAGLTTPIRNLGDLQKSVAKLTPFFAGAATAAAGAFAVMARSAINTADETAKAAQKIGTTTEALSTLRHAAGLAGLSNEQFTTGLRQLSKTAFDAAAGLKEPAEAYAALGIEVRNADGSMKASDQLLLEVAERFKTLRDGTEKTAIAMRIFGKSGADMIPLLNGGADAIRNAQEEARKLGLEISTKTGKAAEEFNDNLSRLKSALFGVANVFAAEILPTLAQFTTGLVEAVKQGGSLKTIAEGLSAVFKALATELTLVFTILTELPALVGKLAAATIEFAKLDPARAFRSFRQGLGVNVFTGLINVVKTASQDVESGAKGVIDQAVKDADAAVKRMLDTVAKIHGINQPSDSAGATTTTAPSPASPLAVNSQETAKQLAAIEKQFNQTTKTRLQNLFAERTAALQNLDAMKLGEDELARAKDQIFQTFDKKISDEKQKAHEEELKMRQEMAREIQRAAELGREIQLSQLDGAQALFAQEEEFHQRRLQQIEELAVAESEKLKLREEAYRAFEARRTELYQTAEDVRAELDAAYRAGDVTRAIQALQAEHGARLADMEARQTMISAYVENWRVAHQNIASFAASAMSTIRVGLGSAVASIVTGAQKASEAFANLGKQIVAMVVNYIVQRGVAFALDKAFAAAGLGFLKTAVTANVAAAATLAGAWGAAATAAAIATLGTATLAGKAVPVLMASNAAIGAGIAATAGVIGGAAHGGLEYVPQESTFLLQRGERVIQPRQNEQLQSFLDSQQTAGSAMRPVAVNIFLDGRVLAKSIGEMSRDGTLEIHAKAVV